MCVEYEDGWLGEAGEVCAAGNGGLDPLEDRVHWRQVQSHPTRLTTFSKLNHIDQSVQRYSILHQDGSG
jgi:hypothetical protein